MTVLKAYLAAAVYAAICLSLSLIFYKLGADKKYTRKLVHILIGFEWIILNALIGPSFHLLIICLAFLALLVISYKNGRMEMISSDGDNAPGTVYFCISMSIMSLLSWLYPALMVPFGIAVFCTSLGDGFAGVAGQALKRANPKIWKNKTLFGTTVSVLLSLAVSVIFNEIYSLSLSPLSLISIAVFAAILELVTGAGFDNLTLPLGVFVLSYFLIYYPERTMEYMLPVLLSPIVLAVVLDKKLLTRAGTVLAVILDLAVSTAFGNVGFLMMAGFLACGTIIDKIKRNFRAEGEKIEQKSDKTRDAFQVLANSLCAILFSLAHIVSPHPVFLVAFAAAAAEALSDTAASGFGALAVGAFDPFKMRRVEKGTSGGISFIGTLAALIGALVFSVIPTLFGVLDIKYAYIIFISAFAGNLFDSLLGSLMQGKYKCKKCGALTENYRHHGTPCQKISGFYAVDNDIVNLLSGVFASALAVLMYVLAFN